MENSGKMSLNGALIETGIRLADVAGVMEQVVHAVTGSEQPSAQPEQLPAGMVGFANGLLAEANGIRILVGELANALGVDLHGPGELAQAQLPRHLR